MLRATLAVTTAISLAACDMPQALPGKFDSGVQVSQRWAAYSESNPKLVDDGWIASFGSKSLVELVDIALVNNRDIRIAAARLDESRAAARRAGAAAIPGVSAGATVGVEDEVKSAAAPVNDILLKVGVSWEADLWGRIRGNRSAASLDAVAEAGLYEAARQSVAAQVARNWILINGNRTLLQIARNEVAERSKSLENVRARIDERSALPVDANEIAGELALAQRTAVGAENAVDDAIRAMEVLLGKYPAGKLAVNESLPRMSPNVALGLPSDLLERRPDVWAAERQVAAAFHRTNEARAAQLPRLTLSADLTGPGATLADALDPTNILWRLAGGLITPVINGAALQEDVNIANARQEAALANYGKVALTAFREVEDALADQISYSRELVYLQRAEREYSAAIRQQEDRYTAGEIDLGNLSDTRLRYYDIQRAIVLTRMAYLLSRLDLHLALGGSFDRPAPEPTVVADASAAVDG
jgi:NodT family efflux transporter outer membrane factor (OMF) lipoprotein